MIPPYADPVHVLVFLFCCCWSSSGAHANRDSEDQGGKARRAENYQLVAAAVSARGGQGKSGGGEYRGCFGARALDINCCQRLFCVAFTEDGNLPRGRETVQVTIPQQHKPMLPSERRPRSHAFLVLVPGKRGRKYLIQQSHARAPCARGIAPVYLWFDAEQLSIRINKILQISSRPFYVTVASSLPHPAHAAIQQPPKRPGSPMSGEPLRPKDLVPVTFTLDVDKEEVRAYASHVDGFVRIRNAVGTTSLLLASNQQRKKKAPR